MSCDILNVTSDILHVLLCISRGGTKLTVSGTSIDAVAAPKIKYGVLHCKIINETSVFEEVGQDIKL